MPRGPHRTGEPTESSVRHPKQRLYTGNHPPPNYNPTLSSPPRSPAHVGLFPLACFGTGRRPMILFHFIGPMPSSPNLLLTALIDPLHEESILSWSSDPTQQSPWNMIGEGYGLPRDRPFFDTFRQRATGVASVGRSERTSVMHWKRLSVWSWAFVGLVYGVLDVPVLPETEDSKKQCVRIKLEYGANNIGEYLKNNCTVTDLYPDVEETIRTLQNITVGDVNYGYYLFGNDTSSLPPLVMIMGFSGTIQQWPPPLFFPIAKTRRVLLFDNRGIGSSQDNAPPEELTMQTMASSTVDLIRELELGTPDLFGWSMGGEISLTIAALHPTAVRKIISLAGDIGGPSDDPSNEAQYQPVWDILNSRATSFREWDLEMATLFPAYLDNTTLPEESSCTLVRSFESMPGDAPTQEQLDNQSAAEAKFANDRTVYDRISTTNKSILLLTGAEDMVVPPETQMILFDRIPGVWLGFLPRTGHGAMYSYPELMANLVGAFTSMEGAQASVALTDQIEGIGGIFLQSQLHNGAFVTSRSWALQSLPLLALYLAFL